MIDLKITNYGIVSTTPDSFSDGGSYTAVDVAYQHALHLLEAGGRYFRHWRPIHTSWLRRSFSTS